MLRADNNRKENGNIQHIASVQYICVLCLCLCFVFVFVFVMCFGIQSACICIWFNGPIEHFIKRGQATMDWSTLLDDTITAGNRRENTRIQSGMSRALYFLIPFCSEKRVQGIGDDLST